MNTVPEIQFHQETIKIVEQLKNEIRYNPTRFIQMLSKYGGPETAHRLLKSAGGSDGFTTLGEAGRLEMSVEAMVVLPWYQALFSPTERAAARKRLTDYGFDVDKFINVRSLDSPNWTLTQK